MNNQNISHRESPELIARPELKINQQMRDSLCYLTGEKSLDSLTANDISYLQAYLEQVKVNKIRANAKAPITKYCTSVGDQKSRINYRKPINTWDKSVNYPNCPKPIDVQDAIPGPAPHGALRESLVFQTLGGPATDYIARSPTNFASCDSRENFMACKENNFYNPYQYGGTGNQLGSVFLPTYTGPYAVNPEVMDHIQMPKNLYQEQFPGAIRNVNIESALKQKELTHGPGQRDLTEREINRFNILPFDPQDTNHIVWQDNMPRGGYPTRVDRLETF